MSRITKTEMEKLAQEQIVVLSRPNARSFNVKPIQHHDKDWVRSLKDKYFSGAEFIVTRGRKVFPVNIPGFFAETADGERLGYLGYEVSSDNCELVTLDASTQFQGVGTALVEALANEGRAQKWKRIWLITTNDNLDALRFYQRRGFSICAVYPNAIEGSRKLKPSIPIVGNYGIRIRDEIELEMML